MSRRARAIPVYAALRSLGRAGSPSWSSATARSRAGWRTAMRASAGVEILNDVVLNQVLLRFDDDDATTRAVVEEVQRGGEAWLGGTVWRRPGRRARVGLELVDDRGRRRPPARGALAAARS